MSEQAPPVPQEPVPAAQENKQQTPANDPPKQQAEQKKPAYTGYKLYERTQFETNKRLRERREKAILSKEISLALFGRRRFRRIDLTCTLNNFYATLSLASIFHRRVAGLYLIIQLDKVQFTEFADSADTEGKAGQHSVFRITLTKYPTEKDRSSVGFNEAFKAEDITNPIDGLLQRKQRKRNPNRKERKGRNQDRAQREPRERKERQPRQNRERREREREQEPKQRRNRQYEREGRRENDRQTRERNQNRERPERQDRQRGGAKREKDEYEDRTHRRNYRDREEKRDYRESNQSYRRQEDRKQYREKDKQKTYQQKVNREKQEQPRYREKRQGDEGNYRRGQTKSRGTGRIAPHNYEPSHLRNERKQQPSNRETRRNEDRGARRPKPNRYSDDEDW